MIPKQTIEEILNRTDLENLISSYVSLRRAGNNMIGLCPFHNEKTPSFTVFPSQNSFFCFGCSTGGDAITFIRKIENLDYPDAVEMLAKRAGITIVQEQTSYRRSDVPHAERSRVLAMNRDAARFYHKCLMDDHPDAAAAREYLLKKRGLSQSTVNHFGLGFAPNSYDATSKYLKGLGYTDIELTEGYMAFKNERSSSMTDSFRNRIMFPIIDPAGNVMAFGGRVMDNSDPKYKNTSDTPAFKKSKNLFALNFAKDNCKDSLILCEGYMDVISLHASGFENAVATLGTAITPEQARIISRYTQRVIIAYDMDAAGRKAADKAMKLFDEVGVEVKLLKLAGAKDPDEYIKNYGAPKFRSLLEASDSKFEYNYARITSDIDLTDPQQKIIAVNRLASLVADFSNSIERDIYIREISKRMDVSVDSIRSSINKSVAAIQKKKREAMSEDLRQKTLGYRDQVNPDFAKSPVSARYEETVLGLMLTYPEYTEQVRSGAVELCEDDFFTEFGKRVFNYALSLSRGEDESNINEVFSPDEVGRITKMRINRMMLSENGNQLFLDSVAALKKSVVKKKSENSEISAEDLLKIIADKAKQSND